MFTHQLVVYIPQMLQKFHICQGYLPRHLGCFYQVFHTSLGYVLHLHMLLAYYVSDVEPPISLCTSCKCSGNSAFFQDIYKEMRVHFFRFSAQDMYYLCTNLVVHILQMLRKFRIFPGHFTQIPGLFFCTSPGHVLHLHMLNHFFGCSSHPWDMYYICTMGVIFYFGHLATNLFAHILQMPWKFRTFPGHL